MYENIGPTKWVKVSGYLKSKRLSGPFELGMLRLKNKMKKF